MSDTPPGLRYVDDARPGITRVRRGTGFSYHHPDGGLVSDDIRSRIESLVIPPITVPSAKVSTVDTSPAEVTSATSLEDPSR